MMNPAMFGISPQQMEQAKDVGQHIKMEITKYPKEGKLEIKYILINPDENVDLGGMVDQLADQLAWGHATMFDIKGKIRIVG